MANMAARNRKNPYGATSSLFLTGLGIFFAASCAEAFIGIRMASRPKSWNGRYGARVRVGAIPDNESSLSAEDEIVADFSGAVGQKSRVSPTAKSSAAAEMDDLDGTTNAAAFAAAKKGNKNFLRSWLSANFEKESDATGTTLDTLNLSSESIAGLVDGALNRKSKLDISNSPEKTVKYKPRSFANTIGNTALVELTTITPRPAQVKILLKCEFQNPGLSIKDRIAQHILDEAERSGDLKAGATVVAASSGNTAAAFAMLCSVRGYPMVAITNTKCSDEKVNALKAYGAQIVVTKSGVPPDHPEHYQQIEDRLVRENPSWFGVNQYDNPMNPEAYYKTIAPEIWEQTSGEVTHFIAAASTGGTVSGIGRYLKDQSNGRVQVLCPDPVGSIFHEHWKSGGEPPKDCGESFQVEGVGKDSIPANLDIGIIDDMPQVTDKDAFKMCRMLSEQEGLMCGGSTGVNVHAAVELAKTLDLKGDEKATIVCIAPDSGVKYLSKVYNREWLLEKGFVEADEA